MNLFRFSFYLLFMAWSFQSFGQGTSNNNNGAIPNPSAMLDVSSTVKGILIPRMTIAQRDAISNPAEGLQVYNLDCHNYDYWNGSSWGPVNNIKAVVSITVNPTGNICPGTNVTFTATPTLGGSSPLYQWKVNGVYMGNGGTTYSSSSLNNGDAVFCELTSNSSCVTLNPATSNTIKITYYPTATLTSSLNPAICSGAAFNYSPASSVSGTTFTWSRAAVTGISNSSAAGSGNISETLINTTSAAVNATYVYILVSNGCSYVQNVVVTVNALPTASGLVGYWPLEGNTTDLSGLNNSGSATAITYSSGMFSQSGFFNGTTSFISVPDNASIDANTATWSFLIKLTSFPSPSTGFAIMSKQGATNQNGLYINLYANGQIAANIWNASSSVTSIGFGNLATTNAWHHILITFSSGGSYAGYLDGALISSGSCISFSFATNNPLTIGKNSDSYWQFLPSGTTVDGVRICNRVLSSAEIQFLYSSTCQK